jgi:hypothetical protein
MAMVGYYQTLLEHVLRRREWRSLESSASACALFTTASRSLFLYELKRFAEFEPTAVPKLFLNASLSGCFC